METEKVSVGEEDAKRLKCLLGNPSMESVWKQENGTLASTLKLPGNYDKCALMPSQLKVGAFLKNKPNGTLSLRTGPAAMAVHMANLRSKLV